MGFDVDAWIPGEASPERKAVVSEAFRKASEEAHAFGNGVDSFLCIGSLDCGGPIDCLSRALGRELGPDMDYWQPDEVRALAESARWPDPATLPPDLLWHYWSARKFLEVCVEQGLGIYTS